MGPLRQRQRDDRHPAGETCALRWEDVDFDTKRLHVRRAVCKGITVPPS
ncbi:MAG: hypothetical protein ACRDKA_01910 [Actinomycetota bacterium]